MQPSDVVALVALVVSITAAYFSYRLGQRTVKVMAYHGASDMTLQMDQVFIEYPMLRPYFCEGEPIPADLDDPELRNRILAVAEFVVDILENCWDHEDCYAGDDRDSWNRWICDVFASSPACCEHYAKNIAWYPALDRLFDERASLPEEVQRAIDALPSVRTGTTP